MANTEHVQRLKEGVASWNAWRSSVRPIDTPYLDLSQADFSQADLSGADLTSVNLFEANLSGCDLRESKLNWAELSEANLRYANLYRVDLTGARLINADLSQANLGLATLVRIVAHKASFIRSNLRDADLAFADLQRAKLTEADLRQSTLRGSDLTEVDLSGADFTGADLENVVLNHALCGACVFGDVDLSKAQGLETMKHNQRSTIGIDTIVMSEGKIPEVFLRGVGAPEAFITYMSSLLAKSIEFYSCFISYAQADKSFARRLHDTLQGRGVRCWLDEHQLLPGDDIYEGVDRGIRLWDKVLLCCSKASLSSWWVDSEIVKAFAKEQELYKQRNKKTLALIPLNLDDTLFNWQDGKKNEVCRRLAANFTGWEHDNRKFETQIELLVRALRADDGGRERPPKTLL